MDTRIITVTDAGQFKQCLQDAVGLVVVDFWAPWCGPCRMMVKPFAEAADAFPNVTFLKVNVDENDELSLAYKVRSIPMLLFFKNGEKVAEQIGLISFAQLQELIEQQIN